MNHKCGKAVRACAGCKIFRVLLNSKQMCGVSKFVSFRQLVSTPKHKNSSSFTVSVDVCPTGSLEVGGQTVDPGRFLVSIKIDLPTQYDQ
jgi:hypothetical protein